MNRTLIIQSHAPNAPEWIRSCCHAVEAWAHDQGFEYLLIGDELFNYCRDFPMFPKVTRTDIARLRMMRSALYSGGTYAAGIWGDRYDCVYWIDADFLIWDRADFTLPIPSPGEIVCVREAVLEETGITRIAVNNCIVGACEYDDAQLLVEQSAGILGRAMSDQIPVCPTVIGTEFFSSPDFPLRRIEVRNAGCLSAASIKSILGPYISGRKHIFWLGVANGDTLRAANLCSSRETDDRKMDVLVADLIHGETAEIGRWRYFTPFYRTWLRLRGLPFRLFCWWLTRWGKLRMRVSGVS